jgi:DeoR family transcriptional regulator, aga operon transcriptional repressor
MPGRPVLVLADERRRAIAKMARKEGRVSIGDLVRNFDVSPVTLRADLRHLAQEGVLDRCYGGAMVRQEPNQDVPLTVKQSIHNLEKVRIGRAAARLIRARQTVMLDSGSTSAEVARSIKTMKIEGLTIITHALNIAQEFTDYPHASVIMLGGLMRHVSRSFVGPQAERAVQELHAHHFFLGVDGVDPEIGLSTPDLLEAQLNAAMIKAAQEVTVVADASKMGRRSLSLIGSVDLVTRLITDDRLSEEMASKFRKRGVEVVIA